MQRGSGTKERRDKTGGRENWQVHKPARALQRCKSRHTQKELNLKAGVCLVGFDVARGDLEEKGGNKREDGGEQDPAYFH